MSTIETFDTIRAVLAPLHGTMTDDDLADCLEQMQSDRSSLKSKLAQASDRLFEAGGSESDIALIIEAASDFGAHDAIVSLYAAQLTMQAGAKCGHLSAGVKQ